MTDDVQLCNNLAIFVGNQRLFVGLSSRVLPIFSVAVMVYLLWFHSHNLTLHQESPAACLNYTFCALQLFHTAIPVPACGLAWKYGCESQHVRSCKMREQSGFSCSFKRRCGSVWIYKEIVSVFLSWSCSAELNHLGHQEGGDLPVKYNFFFLLFFFFNNNLIFPSLDIKCLHTANLLPNSLSFSCLTEKHLCVTLYGWV